MSDAERQHPIGGEMSEQSLLTIQKLREAASIAKYAKDAKPTDEAYSALDRAFQHFNKELFGGTLPRPIFTFQRRRGTFGYFVSARWDNEQGALADEIALNPQQFRDKPLEDVLATLVHEQCHMWQHHQGEPGRGHYHNRQWAEKMKEIGLYPSTTGEPGGKETGDRVHHYIVPDSPFTRGCSKLTNKGFTLPWKERMEPQGSEKQASEESLPKEAKSGRRVKYTCPAEDHLNAWAKPGVMSLMCADHQVALKPEE